MIEIKKFEADWCGPCKRLKPVFENLEKKVDSNVKISYIDVDEMKDIATQYGVRSIPTVVFEKNGQEVKRILGAQSELTYLNELKSI